MGWAVCDAYVPCLVVCTRVPAGKHDTYLVLSRPALCRTVVVLLPSMYKSSGMRVMGLRVETRPKA